MHTRSVCCLQPPYYCLSTSLLLALLLSSNTLVQHAHAFCMLCHCEQVLAQITVYMRIRNPTHSTVTHVCTPILFQHAIECLAVSAFTSRPSSVLFALMLLLGFCWHECCYWGSQCWCTLFLSAVVSPFLRTFGGSERVKWVRARAFSTNCCKPIDMHVSKASERECDMGRTGGCAVGAGGAKGGGGLQCTSRAS